MDETISRGVGPGFICRLGASAAVAEGTAALTTFLDGVSLVLLSLIVLLLLLISNEVVLDELLLNLPLRN